MGSASSKLSGSCSTSRPVVAVPDVRLRIATRTSPLAMTQARRVASLMRSWADRAGVAIEISVVPVETMGDRDRDQPLHRLGGQGVFVKEVQGAVIDGRADLAVHSAKDLPASDQVPGLALASFPERADRRDLLVGSTLEGLVPGARVATGSARRRVQLANARPDLTFDELRGNMATRLAVAGQGATTGSGAPCVVVAKAAVDRLAWTPPPGLPVDVLDVTTMVPQVGQGALAVECREGDEPAVGILAAIDDPAVRREVLAERAFLAELGGGCTLPVGATAYEVGGLGPSVPRGAGGTGTVPGGAADPGAFPGRGSRALTLVGMIASEDGRVVLRHEAQGDDPATLGRSVARYLLDDAGGRSLGPWEGEWAVADEPRLRP